jgi:lysophospholipase L1-like esterase
MPLRRAVLDRRRPPGGDRLARWQASPAPAGALALAGDSLAAEVPPDRLPAPFLSRGWPGETVAELSRRIGETLARDPATLILLTGTNDVLRGRDPGELARRFDELLAQCRASLPGGTIVALSLPPLAARRVPVAHVRAANDALNETAAAHGVLFVDVFAVLADASGEPLPGMSRDGVHLTSRGYCAIASLLRQLEVLPR